MADMLLDLTVFDDLRNGDAQAREIVESILDGETKAAISPMTVYELWRSGEIDRRTEIGFLSILRFVEEASPDVEIARAAGLSLNGGDDFDGRDAACVAVAAATAKSLGIPVCTRDAESFERFEVEITTY